MLRTVLSVIGLGMVARPRQVVKIGERLAFENPGEARLRGWTVPIARLEGMGYLVIVRRTGFGARLLGLAFGLFGAVAAVAPRQYLRFGLSLAYENPDDISVKPWVIPVTRIVGLAASVLMLASLRTKGEH